MCIAVLGFSLVNNSKVTQERARQLEEARKNQPAEPSPEKGNPPESEELARGSSSPDGPVAPSVPAPREITLSTDLLRLSLTNRGAGIARAELLEHRRELDSEGEYVTINETREAPIGALSSEPNEVDLSLWTVKEEDERSVVFQRQTPDGLFLEKTFRLPDEDRPYEVVMELTVRNDSGERLDLGETDLRYLYAGGAAPLHFNEWSMQIGLFYRENESTFRTKTVDYFGGGQKILGIFGGSEKPYAVLPSETKIADNLAWAGVNNQFFATLLHAREPSDGQVWADKYPVVIDGDEEQSRSKRMRGCELAMSLPRLDMKPGDQKTLTYDLYIGPKESSILKQSEGGRELIMNYSQIPVFGAILGWAIQPLAAGLDWGMIKIKGIVGSYGWAIVILTLIIRLLVWPIYAKSARSMKRMSKLAPIMKEIKEKHPDDPQKVNQETMKLYREYGINPLGGCLPMFIQLPVFLAFYRMIWGAAELRHESFLGFVQDLTMPDEVAMIPGLGIPLNILPILMGVTSFIQMAMMPKTGDNTQRMIFMMMPLIFLVICYNFASGLALYWTTSNLFSILQTWVMNKMPEPELTKSAKAKPDKKGFFERLQERMEEVQAQQQGNAAGKSTPVKKSAPAGRSAGTNKPTKAAAKKKSPKKRQQPDMPQPGQSRTKLASERGSRHTKSKKKKR